MIAVGRITLQMQSLADEMTLSSFERVEMTLVLLFRIIICFAAHLLPKQLDTANIIFFVSALMLFQSLIRDLFILARSKKIALAIPFKKARCMCLESTVGISGILIGVGFIFSGFNQTILLSTWQWWAISMAVMISSFLLKDFVIESNPWRIIRDKDHMNILFTWQK